MIADVTAATNAIGEAIPAIAAVGVATLLVLVSIRIQRWLRCTLDEGSTDAWSPGDGDAECVSCGYVMDSDSAIHALENNYCPKCGDPIEPEWEEI